MSNMYTCNTCFVTQDRTV